MPTESRDGIGKEAGHAPAAPGRHVPPADPHHSRRAGHPGSRLVRRRVRNPAGQPRSMVPYCTAQLRAFQRAGDSLTQASLRVAALWVDDENTTAQFTAKHGLTFPLGHSADARAVAALTGAFVN